MGSNSMRVWYCVILTIFTTQAISASNHKLWYSLQGLPDNAGGIIPAVPKTVNENLVDFDSLIESLYEYPEIGKKSHSGGKDESNNDDTEDYDSALRHLIDDLRVMRKNAQETFDGLRVMKKSAQQPAKGDPTMNLRVMRSHDPTIGLRVMRSDPMMNLRVMRSSQNQNSERNAQLLRTANNMNMR